LVSSNGLHLVLFKLIIYTTKKTGDSPRGYSSNYCSHVAI